MISLLKMEKKVFRVGGGRVLFLGEILGRENRIIEQGEV